MGWSKETRIKIMLSIDTAFLFLELGVGIAVGSLALMADAFHMLNDIISLFVGLWAVKASQKTSTDKYSFGWLRAEILGAFFNAVFLIALCMSIVLEAIQRLIDPPEISKPMLILIVGCLGLTSNLAGFFVLGGHGHSHGAEGHDEHSHSHVDGVSEAEEGHGHSHEVMESEHTTSDIIREVSVANAKKSTPHLRFSSDEPLSTDSHRAASRISPRKHRRRTSSIRSMRYTSIDDFSIHPASFRQDIIAASRPQLDGIDSEDNTASEEEAVEEDDVPTEVTSLLPRSIGHSNGHGTTDHDHKHKYDHINEPDHTHGHGPNRSSKGRNDSCHATHNHNKPKKASKSSHGHNHADMGMNAMILHVIGDALGNVGVIVSALIIWLTTWSGRFYADPAVSLFITIIILRSTIPLTAATAKILLQATPDHIEVNDVKDDIQELPGVVSCHHVHIWQLSDTQIVASMHIQVEFPISEASGERYMELARNVRKCLHAYGIHSATIQPEFCLDRDHNHNRNGLSMGLDGVAGQQTCGLDDDLCLLECVDDCQGKGCCSTKSVEAQHEHSDHDGHTH